MEIFRSDVKSGMFIMLALVIFLVAVFEVGDLWERFHPGTELTLHFAHAEQVSQGTAVFLLGRKVGRVKAIEFSSQGTGVNVIASVDANLPLWQGTRAQITDKSLLGGKIIALIPPEGIDPATTQPLDLEQPIPGLPTSSLLATIDAMNLLIGDFRSQSQDVFDHLNRVLAGLDQGIDDTRHRVEHASQIIPKFEATVDKYSLLADTVKTKITGLIDEMDRSLATLVPATTKMEGEVEALAIQLKGDFSDAKQALQSALAEMEALAQRSDQVVADNQVELTRAIRRLNETLDHLEYFSQKIAERPSRIIWSRSKKRDRSDPKPEDTEPEPRINDPD